MAGKAGAGFWMADDRVTVPMDGGSAAVYALQPQPDDLAEPVLFNAPGKATIDGDVLTVTGARGEAGTACDLVVRLPAGRSVASATVNGTVMPMKTVGRIVTLRVRFYGAPFRQYQPIVDYNPAFPGGRLEGQFTIPQRIFDHLAARRKAWPIPRTAEDFRSTWLVPERLLLFVQMAEPASRCEARLTIDGRTVEVTKAYSAIRVAPRTFVGFYADLSMLAADRERWRPQPPEQEAGVDRIAPPAVSLTANEPPASQVWGPTR